MVANFKAARQPESARKLGIASIVLSVIGIVIGIILYILLILIFVVGGVATLEVSDLSLSEFYSDYIRTWLHEK